MRRQRSAAEDRARQGRARPAARRRQPHRAGEQVALLRAQRSVRARPLVPHRSQAGAAGTARHAVGRDLQRQPRLRDRCCAPDGTFSAGLHHVVPGQLDRDRDDGAARAGRVASPRAHLRRVEPRRAASASSSTAARRRARRHRSPAAQHHLRRRRRRNLGRRHPPLRIGRRHDETLQDVSVDELRVYDRQLTTFEVARSAGAADPLGAVAATPAAQRHARAQQAALREHYVLRVEPARSRPRCAR